MTNLANASAVRPRRIGLNLLYLIPGQVGGVETYARSLIQAILDKDQYNHYVVFVSRVAADLPLPSAPNLELVVVPINNQRRGVRYAWEQLALPLQAWKKKLDVLHSLNYVGPLWSPCRSIVTVHDANHCVVGGDMPLTKRLGLGFVSTLAARRSDSVVTVSEFSKAEIVQRMKVNAHRIRVIHSGAGWQTGETQKEVGSPEGVASVLAKYNIVRPYISAFSGGYPHKNIPFLLRAFDHLAAEYDMELVLIGRLAPGVSIRNTISARVLPRVKHLGHIPTADIPAILSGSQAFVFPSLYEGFGFPILEAHAARAPVVCSTAGSIPEVAGLAAEYFDPHRLDSVLNALRKVVQNRDVQEQLRVLGDQNLSRFSWKTAAERYLAVYGAA